MKNKYTIATMAAGTLLLSACATTQPPESLVELRQNMETLEQNEQANRYAPVALQDAKDQLRATESAWKKEDESLFEHELYLAEQYVSIVEQESQRGELQEKIDQTDERRKDMMLSQKEQELTQREQQVAAAKEEARQAQEQVAALKAEMKNVKTEDTDRGMVLTMSDVLFAFNSTELKLGGKKNLEKLADFLTESPNTKATVEGFTDSQGNDSYNIELSRQRAQAVVDQLTAMGVEKDRLVVKAYGEDYPIATNDTASGRQQNRRVQVVINDAQDIYQGPTADQNGMQVSSKASS